MRPSIVIAILSAAAAVVLHDRADFAMSQSKGLQGDPTWVPNAQTVKTFSLGMDRFLADLYWLSFVQYIGDEEARNHYGYGKSADFVWLICKLDPQFPKVYWFGCWSVGYWQKRPDLADEILRFGMSHNPDDWEIPFMAGINQYLFNKNAHKAAEYYKIAATKPKCPAFVPRQAEILASKIPEFQKRMAAIWDVFSSTNDLNMKRNLAAELIAFNEQIIKLAPSEVNRQAARHHIELVKKLLAEAEEKK